MGKSIARAVKFDIGAGGVEVSVVRNDVSRFAQNGKQDALCGTAIVPRK
jgi:hypothetical protein